MKTSLFCIIVFLLDFSASASVRIKGSGIRSAHQDRQSRSLRLEQNEYTEVEDWHSKSAPKEINVDPRSTYNEKFMALMRSPCRPEYDGFFGATSGDPIRIQYGFKVEIEPLSAIMEILDAIEDEIVDKILQHSFPDMCGFQRARKTQESSPHDEEAGRSLVKVRDHPSGFRFLKFEEVEQCLPKYNDVNFCGMFTGVLNVYGKHQHGEEASNTIMSYIYEVLNTLEPHDLHSELTSLSSVDKFSIIEGDTINHTLNSERQLSRLGVLLIIISGFIAVAVIYYIYIQRNEQRLLNSASPVDDMLEGKCNSGALTGNFGFETKENGDNDEDHFVDDDHNFATFRDRRGNSCVL